MNTSSTGSPTSPDAEVLAADDEDDVEAAAVSEDAEDVLSAAEDDVEASDVDESAADAAADDAADVAAEEAELLPQPAMVATMAVLIRIAKSLRFISFLPLDTLRLLLPSQLSVLKTGNFRFY